jgi:hypothetical protein
VEILKGPLAVTALAIGSGFILIGLAGGGVELAGAKIPLLEVWQRFAFGLLAAIFFVAAFYLEANKKSDSKTTGNVIINNVGVRNKNVDLDQVPVQFSAPFEIPGLNEFKNTIAANLYSSSVPTFVTEMDIREPVDYAVIDLGAGQEWLTSRLFILSILLARMRGVKALVFVDSMQVTRRFLGWADIHAVRWALARRFVCLESAYRLVHQSGRVASFNGRFEDVGEATSILRSFLEGVQTKDEPKFHTDEWVLLPESGIFEFARWLDHALIGRILEDRLQTRCINPLPMKPAEQTRAVLEQDGQFVALVNDDRRFERLVNRQVMVDELTRRLFRSQDGS